VTATDFEADPRWRPQLARPLQSLAFFGHAMVRQIEEASARARRRDLARDPLRAVSAPRQERREVDQRHALGRHGSPGTP
jgi:hypothetical protein